MIMNKVNKDKRITIKGINWESKYTMKEFIIVAEGYKKGEKITDERNRETINNKLGHLINGNVERYVNDDGAERYNEQSYQREAAEHVQNYIKTGDIIEIIREAAKDPNIKISIIGEMKE